MTLRTLGPVASNPKNNGFHDIEVDFVDGVGSVPESTLIYVYQAYDGRLRDRTVRSDLLEGDRYLIDSWIDVKSSPVSATNQIDSSIPVNPVVHYL